MAVLPAWILVFTCIFCGAIKAQNKVENTLGAGKSLGELRTWVTKRASPFQHSLALFQPFEMDFFEGKPFAENSVLDLQHFEFDVHTNLAFFCRIEHELAVKIQTPIKFRLGSVQYVDWLEGKPGCDAYGY